MDLPATFASGLARRNYSSACVVACVLLVGVVPAAALVIDDMETGGFVVSIPAGEHFSTALPTQVFHCMAPLRSVTVSGGDTGHVNVQIIPDTQLDDELVMEAIAGGGSVDLKYEPATPVDFTSNGNHNRLEFRVTEATVPGQIFVIVKADENDPWGSQNVYLNGPGTYYLPFTEFPGVDLHNITFCRLQLFSTFNEPGTFRIADIRTGHSLSPWLWHDWVWEEVGPPFPSDPVICEVFYPVGDRFRPMHDLHISLYPDDAGVSSPIRLIASDSGGDVGVPGLVSGLSFEWEGGAAFNGASFNLVHELRQHGDLTPVLQGLPAVQTDARAFALTSEVHYLTPTGEIAGISIQTSVFTVGTNQPLQFVDERVQPLEPVLQANKDGMTGFRLTFSLLAEDAPDLGEPLLTADLQADFTATGSTSAVGEDAIDAATGRALWAQPSFTEGGTEFHFASATTRRGRLDVYDLRGRAVRRLNVSAGQAVVAWDGRNSHGVPVAAGVYLVRFDDKRATLTTRVVRVR